MRRTPERDLPEPFASWIDKAAPLPAGVRLLPRTISPVGDALQAVLLAVPVMGMSVVLATVVPWGADLVEENWPFFLLLGIVFVALSIAPIWQIRRAILTALAARDQRQGQLRQGMFLGPDGMLVRLELWRSYLVGWDQFSQARIHPPPESRGRGKRVFVIETHDDKLEFFAERIDAVPKQIHRYLQDLEPSWSPPGPVASADCEQRKDEINGKKLLVAALRFGGAMLLLLGVTAAIIAVGEKSPVHDWLAFAWLIAFLVLIAAVVNVFYRFGRVSWRYHCPACGERKLPQVHEALPEFHYYCRVCNVEWDTGWEVKDERD